MYIRRKHFSNCLKDQIAHCYAKFNLLKTQTIWLTIKLLFLSENLKIKKTYTGSFFLNRFGTLYTELKIIFQHVQFNLVQLLINF